MNSPNSANQANFNHEPVVLPRGHVVWLGGVLGTVTRRVHGWCTIERVDGRSARVELVEDIDDPTPHIPKVRSIDYLDVELTGNEGRCS